MFKEISIDNGHTFVTPAYAVANMDWDTIVNAMDDETRESVHAEGIEDKAEFLARYLELSDTDLIIG